MTLTEITILLSGAWIGCVLTHAWQFLRWVHQCKREQLARLDARVANIADYQDAKIESWVARKRAVKA